MIAMPTDEHAVQPRVRSVDALTPNDAMSDLSTSATKLTTASMRAQRPAASCVVPCHNEANNLAELLPLLQNVLNERAADWEIILVDDGSTDNTAAVLENWATQPRIRAIQLSRNFGKEAALTAGMQAARGDVVIMIDADLQHPPNLITEMIDHWQRGADVAYAVRTDRSDEGKFKRVGTKWFYRFINMGDRFEVPAGAGDFRLMDRAVVDALLSLPERNRFMKGLYAWVGFHAVALPYVPTPRAYGETKFNRLKLLRLSMDGITAFTTWPLRLVSLVGLVMALAGFSYGGYLTVEYLIQGHPVSGWTTIIVCLLLFLGVQMIAIGILGEYVARIFEEVKGRPLYVVKRELGVGLKAQK